MIKKQLERDRLIAGFTIVEVIVVVTIIAVLVSIILVSVTQYNNAGRNTAIKGNLANLLTEGVVYYESNNNNYSGFCSSGAYSKYSVAIDNAFGAGVVQNCNVKSDNTAWCACAQIKTTDTEPANSYFCVDSFGTKKVYTGQAANFCSSICSIDGVCVAEGSLPPPPPPPPPPTSDTEPPSVPTGLAATVISYSKINLSWSASTDNVGVAGYKVFRDAVQVADVAVVSYSDIGLTGSTTYSYTVLAYDAANNSSNQSSSVNATTPATPALSADGDGYNRTEELFVDRPSDFNIVKQVFNTVLISPGTQSWVTDCLNAGLKCILEFDYKWDFIAGIDITQKVQDVINQVNANPGTISGIFVADRLNGWANDPDGTGPKDAIPPDKMVEYLSLTGGVFHQQLPGMPVIVDVEDLELVCGQPGQLSCSYIQSGSTSMYRYQTNAILTQLKNTGYADIFYIANSLARDCTDPNSSQCWDVIVQRNAWQTARSLWPEPFKIMYRTAGLSFPESTYPYNSIVANKAVTAAITVPLQEGANGTQLWGWHIPYIDGLRTWLNKDASSNVLWEALKNAIQ